jgi:integral membrane protein (TIGR01906 family)
VKGKQDDMAYNKTMVTIVRWLIILSMPFLLGLGMVRAIILWDYPGWEYARIEPDRFGFTPEQRLDLAHDTLDYMQRLETADHVIYLLEDLRLPGTDQPLYNPAEIGHMIDVKNLTDAMLFIVVITLTIVMLGMAYLLGNPATNALGWKTFFQAGLFTVIILAAIAVFILLAWEVFFTQFHELLFPPGTWTFAYSDSLIRLFPEQFWFDIGVILSGGTLFLGALVALIGWLMWRRKRARLLAA